MIRKMFAYVSIALAAAGAPGLFAAHAITTEAAKPYPAMAPIKDYLMDRDAEIALARSSTPAAIAKDATVLVLTRAGYQTAVKGPNGFVCLVERGFAGAPDWSERWNPKIRAAACLNPQAVRAILPIDVMRSNMTVAGRPDVEIWAHIKAALRSGEIPPLGAGAMCYMMSKAAYLTDFGGHGMAHVMFYIPEKDGAGWGANAEGSPVMGGNYWLFSPDHAADAAALPPIAVLLVGTTTWADGTPAAMHAM